MKQFDLLAYCILPNHVHLLVRKLGTEEHFVGAPTAQHTLGSVRCEEGTYPDSRNNAFLFSHRRLPSRRSLERRPTLSDLMHSIKSTLSHSLQQGKFWQHRSNFRIVETETYLANVVEYIRYNYRKINLLEHYGQSPFVFIDEVVIHKLLAG